MKNMYWLSQSGNDTVIPWHKNWKEVIIYLDSQGEPCSCPCLVNPSAKSRMVREHLKF